MKSPLLFFTSKKVGCRSLVLMLKLVLWERMDIGYEIDKNDLT